MPQTASVHPGHADPSRVDEFGRTLTDGRIETLDLDGPILTYESDAQHGTEKILDQLRRIPGDGSGSPGLRAEQARSDQEAASAPSRKSLARSLLGVLDVIAQLPLVEGDRLG